NRYIERNGIARENPHTIGFTFRPRIVDVYRGPTEACDVCRGRNLKWHDCIIDDHRSDGQRVGSGILNEQLDVSTFEFVALDVQVFNGNRGVEIKSSASSEEQKND